MKRTIVEIIAVLLLAGLTLSGLRLEFGSWQDLAAGWKVAAGVLAVTLFFLGLCLTLGAAMDSPTLSGIPEAETRRDRLTGMLTILPIIALIILMIME